MTRKSLFAVILAVVGLAFVLGGMAVDPASAKGLKRDLHSVELLPVTSSGNVVVSCEGTDGPGDCESDGFGTAAVATDNNFQVTSWGATLQNLLRYTDYYLSVRSAASDDTSPCNGVPVYGGTAMWTDKFGLASRNELSAPTVTEGDIVDVCDYGGWQILTGDLAKGGKENVHKNNAKNK